MKLLARASSSGRASSVQASSEHPAPATSPRDGFRVQGLRVQCPKVYRVSGSGFSVEGLGFRVWGLGFRV